MASNIEIKRSAVPGKVPTTSSLQLGQIALNTYDGKAYFEKNNGTGSIVELVSTNHSGSIIITGSILMSGSSFISGVDYIDFDTTASNAAAIARLKWNDTDGTLDLGLKGGNVTLQIGQESLVRVVNKTATNITLLEANYQAVRLTGAQGQRLKVDLAQATSDGLSAETLGLVTETIANNQEGFVTTNGLVRGIDTRGTVLQGESWADGDVLYLSPTTAGNITNIKPVAPDHLVIIGYVVYAHQTQGSIFVKVDNGYEIDELHNVKINTGSLTSGQLLVRSGSVWINSTQLTGSYGLTGSLTVTGGITGSLFGTASFATTASFAMNGGGGATFPFSGSAIITGSLLISGSGLTITGSITQGVHTASFGGIVSVGSAAADLILKTEGESAYISSGGGLVEINGGGSTTVLKYDSTQLVINGSGYSVFSGGNVGIGNFESPPAYTLDVVGGVRAIKLHSSGSRPTITPGTNMGTGRTATVYGDNVSGIITLNTSSSAFVGTGNQTLVTLTFSSAYTNSPIVVITPATPVTFTPYISAASTTGFSILNCNGNVVSSSTYNFNYHVIEANDGNPA